MNSLHQWSSTWAKSLPGGDFSHVEAPLGAILCVVGAISWFARFGGRFQFLRGRFLQV